jgi:hypothetical protein
VGKIPTIQIEHRGVRFRLGIVKGWCRLFFGRNWRLQYSRKSRVHCRGVDVAAGGRKTAGRGGARHRLLSCSPSPPALA